MQHLLWLGFHYIKSYLFGGFVFINVFILIGCLWGLFEQTSLTPVVVNRPTPHMTTITVPAPIFSERVITQFTSVEDRAAINRLERENKKLRTNVEMLSFALAQYSTSGGGTIIVDPTSPTPPNELPSFTFDDWRLSFRGQGTTAAYTLTQRFKIFNTVGKTREGVTTNLIRLYELGPNQEQYPITTVNTTTLVEATPPEGWYTKLNVQGGWAVVGRVHSTPNTPNTPTGMVTVALPWLKHGTTRATEKTRWAVFSPAMAISANERSVGLLPISFNLGTLSRQPFSNVWVSPFVGTTNGTTMNRMGIVLSATF